VETLPREVCLDPRFLYNFTAPRFAAELPLVYPRYTFPEKRPPSGQEERG
jgi:hypothetical protein